MAVQPLRFLTFLAPNLFPVYHYIVDYLARSLGCQADLSVGMSFDPLQTGQADGAFFCGLPYVQLTRQPPPPVELLAAPILQGDRYQGRPIYFSDVIVHRDSALKTFADLRGCTWAYNEIGSHSGYNITRYRLLQLGETGGFFGRVVAAGSHQQAIELVQAGEVDAAAIDSQVLAVEMHERPTLTAKLRVIEALGPSPGLPIVVARQLSPALKSSLRALLIDMDQDPEAKAQLARGCIERFVAVTDSDYDPIREMVAAAEVSGFMVLR
jgi:phosphonate transport system substrate-binding protein